MVDSRPLPLGSTALRARLKSHRDRVLETIREAERAAGRAAGSVELLAVVKHRSDEELRALADLGQQSVAENRVQALRSRGAGAFDGLELHFIGSLQTNKARRAVDLVNVLHTVDRPRLVDALAAALESRPTPLDVFVQVNIGREPQKAGADPDEADRLCEQVAREPTLRLRGLMAMAPRFDDPAESRRPFASLRSLSERLRREGALPDDACELSMGMSRDYIHAVHEGATCVRVGTALFAETPAAPRHPDRATG